MKIAIQFVGGLRSFRKCLPGIFDSLGFNRNPENYDIFFLLDRKETQGYTKENEDYLIEICKGRIKVLKYTDEFDFSKYVRSDINKVKHNAASKKIWFNNFVPTLYAMRHIVNNMRNEYEKEQNIKYDLVIKTRVDVTMRGQLSDTDLESIYNKCKDGKFITGNLDTLSISIPEAINYESELGLMYPVIDETIWDNNTFNNDPKNNHFKYNSEESKKNYYYKWTYSPEFQLFYHYYIKDILYEKIRNITVTITR